MQARSDDLAFPTAKPSTAADGFVFVPIRVPLNLAPVQHIDIAEPNVSALSVVVAESSASAPSDIAPFTANLISNAAGRIGGHWPGPSSQIPACFNPSGGNSGDLRISEAYPMTNLLEQAIGCDDGGPPLRRSRRTQSPGGLTLAIS
jgi:hypothetical protein